MTIREEIIKEAMTWENTPYHDHAGIKGAGVDCAYFPLRVYQAVGLIPKDFNPPHYSPQQWLNSPKQNKLKLRFEDTTFLDVVRRFTKKEITEKEVLPGDFVLYKVAASWTHGGIIVRWPDFILHPLLERGVIGSHGTKEGFLQYRPRRFFSVVEEKDE